MKNSVLKIRQVLLNLIIVLLFSSCEQGVLQPNNSTFFGTTPNNIATVDGRLFFTDTSQIKVFMKFAQKADFNAQYKELLISAEEEGFVSLYPEYEENDYKRIEQVLSRKIEERKLWGLASNNTIFRLEDQIEEEDEIIGDPYFASILNENREIQVNEDIYKYTLDGVFKTNKDNVKALYDYLEKNPRTRETQAAVTEVAFKVYLIDPIDDGNGEDVGDGDSTGGGTTGGGSTGGGSTGGGGSNGGLVEFNPDDLSFCGTFKDNIFTNVFGPKVECKDYFSSTNRIKTQVWNQNYLLFSSIGISVKSSTKRLGIWWSRSIDELRLGIDQATFKYPDPGYSIEWPNNEVDYYFADHNGYYVDQLGNAVYPATLHPINFFESFPIKDKDKEFIVVTAKESLLRTLIPGCDNNPWNQCTLFEVDGKDINSATVDLFKRIWNIGEYNLESKPLLLIEIPDNTLSFSYVNWNKKKNNDNALRNVFDYNTVQITVKLNSRTNYSNPKVSIKKWSSKYDELLLTGFGAGKSGSKWRGNLVEFRN